jgi:hypothetical protein
MEGNKTPVLAGVGGVAILAAMLSLGGKPAAAPDANKAGSRAQKAASAADITIPVAPNWNGPWYAVCREYSTYKFDDGPKQRLTGGYVEVESPDKADPDATEVTRTVNGVQEKFTVKNYLRASLASCIPEDQKHSVQVMIAMVADPDETEMRLQFDRDIDAIQQGAEAQGYFYTGFWFPWRQQSWADEKKKGDENEAEALRRQEPGVLVFRKSDGKRLFVFVVGETPTSGVNRVQMALALRYSGELYPASATGDTLAASSLPQAKKAVSAQRVKQEPAVQAACIRGPISISGPQFSASFLSLADVLGDVVFPGECGDGADGERSVRIVSPNATANDLIEEFKKSCGGSWPNCAFLPLALSEKKTQDAALDYLTKTLGYKTDRVAHLAESESAFGETSAVADSRFGLEVHFPRELSSLRSASDKESEQISASLANVLPAAADAGSVKLSDDAAGERDRPTTYSPQEEAADVSDSLASTVRLLHAHRIQAVVVSATNPLDRIAIIEYLHNQMPDMRVVVSDAEQIETNRPHYVDMAGALSVTGLPTVAECFTIDRGDGPNRDRVSFAESGQEGEFLATVLLLDENLSRSPARVRDFFEQESKNIPRQSLPISVVGEDGYQLLPIDVNGAALTGDTAKSTPMVFNVTIQGDPSPDSNDGPAKKTKLSLIIDDTSPPPRAFYVFALLVFGIGAAHLVLLFLSERMRPTVWTYPRRSKGTMEWKRLYFLFVLNNQVFLLCLLLVRLTDAAAGAFHTRGALGLIQPVVWVLLIGCGVVPAFFLVRAGVRGKLAWAKLGAEKKAFVFPGISGAAYMLMSLWLVLTWDFGSSQPYQARFLCLADGLSPVLPFSCVVVAYGLWALLQLRRVGWVISRKADIEVGGAPHPGLHGAMGGLLPNLETLGGADLLGNFFIGGLVVACFLVNLWAGTRSFETFWFHLWFVVWGLPMLLVTVILTFFQAFSMWRDLTKLLQYLELTPIKDEFEKLGKNGLVDVKIWDLAKPQRLLVLHKLTLEAMEQVFSVNDARVNDAKRAVGAIILDDARGRQATEPHSLTLNTKLNAAMQQAYNALDSSNAGLWGQSALHSYLALRLITVIRYTLLQVRNLLYFVVYGYMLAAVSVMFYPFQGGKSLGELLTLVFVVLLIGVGAIMVGIQRNRVLGRIENGSSEGASYLQIAFHLLAVGGLPALALIASQFPAVAQFALSFLRPVLGVLH